ncbi:helix-turn-helix domain-containing protein [Pusillimonas noertemannii]|uniref:helix-turn-helix domain-containing protein n=1 Tax=Pusillimonas noertemannii TaxID=305977 RepID=UPI0002F93C14|nr:helix-turn-helix domain-containing protein [Pusillimonas noertemannii]
MDELHDSALGLRNAGLISKRRMGEFAALRHLHVREMRPEQIKLLREQANFSQAVFAIVLNTSLSTVQKWEIGDKRPSGPSLKLLNLIERKGIEAVL